MNIDEMPAGREMDALVAEKVFHLRVAPLHSTKAWNWEGGGGTTPHFRMVLPSASKNDPALVDSDSDTWVQLVEPYSTSIEAAWGVVEKLGLYVGPRSAGIGPVKDWVVGDNFRFAEGIGEELARAETAPLAICRAALKMVAQ